MLKEIDKYIGSQKERETYHVTKTLWELIKAKAQSDSSYKKDFDQWINGDAGTIVLRDILADPFKKWDYQSDIYNPHENAWITLDSWAMKVKSNKKTIKFPEITLPNGTVIKFSHYCHFSTKIQKGIPLL